MALEPITIDTNTTLEALYQSYTYVGVKEQDRSVYQAKLKRRIKWQQY